MAGYSATPLVSKLGIKADHEVHFVAAPEGYLEHLGPLPEVVTVATRLSKNTDVVQVFTARRTDLARVLRSCRRTLKPTGMVWVSWPKKSAKVPTDITEDTVREIALPLGFVDVKVCAVTDIWSGLKLVIRRELR